MRGRQEGSVKHSCTAHTEVSDGDYRTLVSHCRIISFVHSCQRLTLPKHPAISCTDPMYLLRMNSRVTSYGLELLKLAVKYMRNLYQLQCSYTHTYNYVGMRKAMYVCN